MAKRKAFEKIDMALPFMKARGTEPGVTHFSPEVIPPSQTRIEFGRNPSGLTSFDFKGYYGKGIDSIVFACQRQIERFFAGEDKYFQPYSCLTLCKNGLNPLFNYLIARCTAELRKFSLDDINRDLIDGYISWLRNRNIKQLTQRSQFCSTKTVLINLGKRNLLQIVTEGENRTFPKNPWPGAATHRRGAKPFSQPQRKALARALQDAVAPLFHADAKPDSYLLTAALLLVSLHTGRNTTPLLEMTTDCLRPHPKADTVFLILFKRRGYATHKVALREEKENDGSHEIEITPTVRTNVANLIRRIITITEPLRKSAPEELRERVWLHKSKASKNCGELCWLSPRTLQENTTKFVKKYGLIDSDNKPLLVNVSRLRKTFVNRIFEILDGNIATTAIAAGHANVAVTDINYLRPSDNARKNFRLMGQVLTEELLSSGIEKTPVSSCTDTHNGQYAPKRDGATCTNFLKCLICRNFVITADDLYKLFSFEFRIQKECNRMGKRKWKQHLGYIPRLIERDIIRPGIEQRRFKAGDVKAARERAFREPHPFWLADSLIADLEAIA